MSDERRKAIALEYLRRLDRGEAFFDLFDDHARVYFPKWGVAIGRVQIERLFGAFVRHRVSNPAVGNVLVGSSNG